MKINIKILLLIISVLILSFSAPKECSSYTGEDTVIKVWAFIKAFKQKDVFDNECFAKKLLRQNEFQYERFKSARKVLTLIRDVRTLEIKIILEEAIDAITELSLIYGQFFNPFSGLMDPCLNPLKLFFESQLFKEMQELIDEMPDDPQLMPLYVPIGPPQIVFVPINDKTVQLMENFQRNVENLTRPITDYAKEHPGEFGVQAAAGIIIGVSWIGAALSQGAMVPAATSITLSLSPVFLIANMAPDKNIVCNFIDPEYNTVHCSSPDNSFNAIVNCFKDEAGKMACIVEQ